MQTSVGIVHSCPDAAVVVGRGGPSLAAISTLLYNTLYRYPRLLPSLTPSPVAVSRPPTTIFKMLGPRSLVAPARQGLRQARQQQFTRVSFARSYAVASSDRVAKFKGTKGNDGKFTVSLIEGDGIGPEISQSVKDIFEAASVPIKWEPVDVTPRLNEDGKTVIPDETIESISRNYVALKGPLAVRLSDQPAAALFNLLAHPRNPCTTSSLHALRANTPPF